MISTMSEHYRYHYSITIETADEVVLECLRAISNYAQVLGNKRIAWGGTKKRDWQRDRNQVTFHFSDPEYRNIFRIEGQHTSRDVLEYILASRLMRVVTSKFILEYSSTRRRSHANCKDRRTPNIPSRRV
jgi:hypothetical protein